MGVGLAYAAGPKAPRGTPVPKCLQHKVPLEGLPGGYSSPAGPTGPRPLYKNVPELHLVAIFCEKKSETLAKHRRN